MKNITNLYILIHASKLTHSFGTYITSVSIIAHTRPWGLLTPIIDGYRVLSNANSLPITGCQHGEWSSKIFTVINQFIETANPPPRSKLAFTKPAMCPRAISLNLVATTVAPWTWYAGAAFSTVLHWTRQLIPQGPHGIVHYILSLNITQKIS